MSKFYDALQSIGVYNTHELLKRFGVPGRDVGLTYYPPQSRSVQPSCTRAYSPTFKTNPKASWYDYGCKTFIGKRSESMPLAMAWAEETFALGGWAPDPTGGGGKVPKYVVDAAKEFLNSKEGK